MDIVCLEELLRHSHPLLRKERMQLAIRLSSSILQFYHTGWIDNAWTSKDFCVLSVKEEEQYGLSQLFVTRRFYSARVAASLEPKADAIDNLCPWYDEPILTKLGFALIELALGRTLPELRKEMGDSIEERDFDFLNFQTAQKLIKSGRIAREDSQGYEDVVKACLRRQYPGRDGSGPKGLDSKDASFFDNAEESILGPLHAEYIKSWG
jgi:hypothetical protein